MLLYVEGNYFTLRIIVFSTNLSDKCPKTDIITHHRRCKPALGSMIRLSELEHYEHIQSFDDDDNDSPPPSPGYDDDNDSGLGSPPPSPGVCADWDSGLGGDSPPPSSGVGPDWGGGDDDNDSGLGDSPPPSPGYSVDWGGSIAATTVTEGELITQPISDKHVSIQSPALGRHCLPNPLPLRRC